MIYPVHAMPRMQPIVQQRNYFVIRYAYKKKYPGFTKAALIGNYILGVGIGSLSSALLAGLGRDNRFLAGVPFSLAFGSFVLPAAAVSELWEMSCKYMRD